MSYKYDTCPMCGQTKDVRATWCKNCKPLNRPKKTAAERFWRYVTKTDTCWLWTGNTNSRGYGIIRDAGRNGKMWSAHRLSYTVHNGNIPDGLHVCHRCDTPACVNPAHLFLGTHQDNIDDRVSKDRSARVTGLANGAHTHPEKVARGSSHYAAKLTDEQVMAIRASKPSVRVHEAAALAASQYGVSKNHIIKLWYGYKWKHL